jgi:hypothetical protein
MNQIQDSGTILNIVSGKFSREKKRLGSYCHVTNYVTNPQSVTRSNYTFTGELYGTNLKCRGVLQKDHKNFLKGEFTNYFEKNFGVRWDSYKKCEELGGFCKFR